MMFNLFYMTLIVSMSAGLAAAVALLIRKTIFRKSCGLSVFMLWGIVLLRFILPFTLTGKYNVDGLMTFFNPHIVYVPAPFKHFGTMNYTGIANAYYPVQIENAFMRTLFQIGAVLWITVMVFLFIWIIVGYIKLLRDYKDKTLIRLPLLEQAKQIIGFSGEIQMYESSKAVSPIVTGVFKQKIILPKGFDLSEQETLHILEHELTHIKYHHNLFKTLCLIIACIHWFNPFAWITLRQIYDDIEKNCDRNVLRKIGLAQKIEYAKTVLAFADTPRGTATGFGGSAEARIKNILWFKKMTVFSVICSFLFIGLAALFLLTSG